MSHIISVGSNSNKQQQQQLKHILPRHQHRNATYHTNNDVTLLSRLQLQRDLQQHLPHVWLRA